MRKKCKRKVWALVNPITHAIEGARVSGDEVLQPLARRELSAIESFRMGHATIQEWSDLVNLMNLCEHMAHRGIGPEAKQVCDDAHAHLLEAARRYKSTGKMGLTGPGLQCMRDLYEYHDLQRRSIARSEYDKHIHGVQNRIKGNAPEVVDVLDEVGA